MTKQELVEKAIKYQLLNELFSETLSDLRQDVIVIKSEQELDLRNLIQKIATGDLIITNSNYIKEQRDFSVIDASGDIILTVSPDGQRINSMGYNWYLENPDEMRKLLRIYEKVSSADTAFTITLDSVS